MSPVSYDRLVRQYRDRIFRFTTHYLGDPDAAQDATQEVFIRLWNHRDHVTADEPLGWLLRVARNVCIDAIRKRSVHERRVDIDSEGLDRMTGNRKTPEEHTAAVLFQDRLRRALRTLDEPQRSIVILREIDEYKYEEISEALNLPLNTVKVYLHRARKALRRELTEVVRYDYA